MRDPSKYMVNGQRVLSVTRVLSLVGLIDLGGINGSVLEAARLRGRAVHEWLHGMESGVLDGLRPDPMIAGHVDGYKRFRDEKKFEVKLVEHAVVNSAYMYAGTLDLTGLMDGDRWLIDIKCVAKVSEETALQTAAYEHCLDERHKRAALQLMANGTYRLHPYTSRNDLHDFLSAVRIAWCKVRWGRATIEEES